MTITNGYATLQEVLDHLGINDGLDNNKLEPIIEAASRWIDSFTGRVFYTTTEVRYFSSPYTNKCHIDDATAITLVETDGNSDRTYSTSWAGTDWETDQQTGWPITEIYTTPNGNYSFPSVRKGVKVTGTWGFSSSVPAAIKTACILLSMRLFRRKDALFGTVETGNVGNVVTIQASIKADADITALLTPYRALELV